MKKSALLFFILTSAMTALCQDTVRYQDPWYLFNQMADLEEADDTTSMVLSSFGQGLHGSYSLQRYTIPDSLESHKALYGIAVVGDIWENYSRDKKHNNPYSFIRVICIQGIDTNNIQEPIFTQTYLINQSICDTANIDSSLVKHCFFEYEYTYPTSHSNVEHCTEVYFDEPIVIEYDTICIGISQTTSFSNRNIVPAIDNSNQQTWYLPYGSSTHPISPIGYYCDTSHLFLLNGGNVTVRSQSKSWGGIFPIIRPRCTAPKQLNLSFDNNIYTLHWQTDTNAEITQIVIRTNGNWSPCPERWLSTSNHQLQLGNLSDDTTYWIYARKACLFSTRLHSDTIWSDWSQPLLLNPPSQNSIASSNPLLLFDVSPNPSSNLLTITTNNLGGQLSLRNIHGHQLLHTSLPLGTSTTTLNIQPLPSGIYLLHLSSPQGSATRKIIIQN